MGPDPMQARYPHWGTPLNPGPALLGRIILSFVRQCEAGLLFACRLYLPQCLFGPADPGLGPHTKEAVAGREEAGCTELRGMFDLEMAELRRHGGVPKASPAIGLTEEGLRWGEGEIVGKDKKAKR